MNYKITTIDRLQIGDTFSWIPEAWYGKCKLTEKFEREEQYIEGFGTNLKFKSRFKYDLKFDAAVVNPPGIIYGVPAKTRIKLYETIN